MEIIGKGTWLDKVAAKLLEREKKLGRDLALIRVESGLGASGIPHVGSLGDAVRAYGIKLALENMGHRSELIAYSDDMDGLRKVPEGLPEWLREHLAKPVSVIPDPFSCHPSYGSHMSSMLLDALDRIGVKYRFQSGVQAYQSGVLVKQIDAILSNSKIIGEKIAELVGQEKFKESLPYFPICGSCGRIYVAEAYEYIRDGMKVRYRCAGTRMGKEFVKGCGHEGEADIRKGEGKLGWKVEFAARWQAFDVRFEAYGKDIADSVKVNDWVADEVLKYPRPLHVRYEMFLDKSGKKISKSLGNVLTPQAWLRYGTPQSIMLLLFKRIVGTRHIGLEDVPKLVDEYDYIEDVYFDKQKVENDMKKTKLRGIYEYINNSNIPASPAQHVPYRLLVQLASVVRDASRVDYIINRLKTYGTIKEKTDDLVSRITLAGNWADDFGKFERTQVVLSDAEKKAVSELIEIIRKESDTKILQGSVFDTARKHGVEPKQFFKILYNILVGTDQGPRLGPYITDVGREKVAEMLSQHVQ